ncbi:MAG: hypothetical protein M0Z30_23030, partial [Actinomycetota bacterium]|nr:hypothetical protein [Actinomycetota bacterium]
MSSGPVGKHAAPRREGWARSKWALIVGVMVVVAGVAGGVVAIAANQGPSAAQKRAQAEAVAAAQRAAQEAAIHQTQAALLQSITVTPASGTANVALDSAVTVSTSSGTLAAVKVVSA